MKDKSVAGRSYPLAFVACTADAGGDGDGDGGLGLGSWGGSPFPGHLHEVRWQWPRQSPLPPLIQAGCGVGSGSGDRVPGAENSEMRQDRKRNFPV